MAYKSQGRYSLNIRFRNGLIVRKRRLVGSGSERDVFDCDYTYRGKDYVLKFSDSASGIRTNRLEYVIYKNAKTSGNHKWFPDFKSITVDSRWLLVEKCVPAEKYHEDLCSEGHEIESIMYNAFPHDLLADEHSGNWGYTIKNERPVILDMGFGIAQLRSVGRAVKVKSKEFLKLTKAA